MGDVAAPTLFGIERHRDLRQPQFESDVCLADVMKFKTKGHFRRRVRAHRDRLCEVSHVEDRGQSSVEASSGAVVRVRNVANKASTVRKLRFQTEFDPDIALEDRIGTDDELDDGAHVQDTRDCESKIAKWCRTKQGLLVLERVAP